MFRKTIYTATEIAEVICRAEGITLEKSTSIHNRMRYLSKYKYNSSDPNTTNADTRSLLQNGIVTDKRGTVAYPALEVFRAALFYELMAFSMDVRALGAIMTAASEKATLGVKPAPSQMGDGQLLAKGGLIDSVRGVNSGEGWFLSLYVHHSKTLKSPTLSGRFLWNGDGSSQIDDDKIEEAFEATPVRTRLTIDLLKLFPKILEQVGVPEP